MRCQVGSRGSKPRQPRRGKGMHSSLGVKTHRSQVPVSASLNTPGAEPQTKPVKEEARVIGHLQQTQLNTGVRGCTFWGDSAKRQRLQPARPFLTRYGPIVLAEHSCRSLGLHAEQWPIVFGADLFRD
ncbi:hypothetical protein SKAU_G00405330 [Synaphobranchus kaupii]|uniref:Uncharacterized protein n=1 Tax=Synaphobranchus kaupii TaxID=118154 RepID=A0A9Q1E9Y3_SYNKA|nr:hypothetical protein SKAU_G00405330 [Synaphobranchus kaupii]